MVQVIQRYSLSYTGINSGQINTSLITLNLCIVYLTKKTIEMDCTQSDCSYELLVLLCMFARHLYCQTNLSLFIYQLISEKRVFIHILSLFPSFLSSLPPYSLAFYIVLLCNTRWTWNSLLALNSMWSCFSLLSTRFTAGSHNAQLPFLFLCSPLTF